MKTGTKGQRAIFPAQVKRNNRETAFQKLMQELRKGNDYQNEKEVFEIILLGSKAKN